jgi:iron complex outermembrane receptor protein
MRTVYLCAASVAAFVADAGHAQTASSPSQPQVAGPGDPATDPGRPAAATQAPPASGDVLQEIVVTAQKREQNLQQVPITITAVTSAQLVRAGVTGTRDLTLVTPGLNFGNQTATGVANIRGIGTRSISPGDEPSVPIYIDGVYQSTTYSGFFSFNNIERIEVLKGPQGTLFGRNALGGAINIITLKPSHTLDVRGDVSYGTDNEVQANGYVSDGISSTLAASVAVHEDRRDGYIPNIVTGKDQGSAKSTGVRAKLLWTPTDRIDLTLGGFYQRADDDTAYSGYALNGDTIAKTVDPTVVIAPAGKTSVGDTYFNYNQHGAFGTLNVDLGSMKLTATQSWDVTNSLQRTDSDATSLDYAYAKIPYYNRALSSELRLASTGKHRFDWIVGAYYFNSNSAYPEDSNGDVFLARSTPTGPTLALISTVKSAAESAFGEVTWNATDKLSITAGGRYSHERRSKDYERSVTSFAMLQPGVDRDYKIGDIVAPVPTSPSTASKDYNNFSGRASAQYEFSPAIRAFATFSQGFKSGFFNASSAPPFVALKPEKVNNYEIGLKTDPSRTLRFNITAFYLTYKNLQVSARSPTNAAVTDVFNAASAHNHGGEAQLDWLPLRGLSLTAGVAYQHARYVKFPNALVYYAATSTDATLKNPCQQGTGTLIGGNRSAICDASGKPLFRAPDWTASLEGNYEFDALSGKINVGGVVYWSDNFVWDLIGNLDNGGDYTTVNANAGWTSADGRFKATVFTNNLFNSHHPLNRYIGPSATYAVDVRPRTVGVRLGFQLGGGR